jgi:hypothetical protein
MVLQKYAFLIQKEQCNSFFEQRRKNILSDGGIHQKKLYLCRILTNQNI